MIQCATPHKTEISSKPAIVTEAYILTVREMARCSFQCAIGGPSFGWVINQLWRGSEPLLKLNAANRRKGVVGSKGKNMPKKPSVTLIQPSDIQRYFIDLKASLAKNGDDSNATAM